ncbi:MAG TPA: hypothetical protein VF145_05135 [Chitinophagaceae bacterium]
MNSLNFEGSSLTGQLPFSSFISAVSRYGSSRIEATCLSLMKTFVTDVSFWRHTETGVDDELAKMKAELGAGSAESKQLGDGGAAS